MASSMTGRTIGGLFTDQARGEAALDQLKRAGFNSAQISEVLEDDAAPPPQKLKNPIADFFTDHTVSGSEFTRDLTELGMPEADAKHFEDGVARGGALVTVKADERASEAVQILQQNGADLGSLGRGGAAPAASGADQRKAGNDETMQLKAERLAVDKVRVASGSARVRKQVVTEQQNIDVPLMHEELVIERRPVSGGTPTGPIGQDETINVPLSREDVKVTKQAYVTEEVDIGKRVVTETQRVSEDVRHEELVTDTDPRSSTPKR